MEVAEHSAVVKVVGHSVAVEVVEVGIGARIAGGFRGGECGDEGAVRGVGSADGDDLPVAPRLCAHPGDGGRAVRPLVVPVGVPLPR